MFRYPKEGHEMLGRRGLLRVIGGTALVGLAGCTGTPDDGDGDGSGTGGGAYGGSGGDQPPTENSTMTETDGSDPGYGYGGAPDTETESTASSPTATTTQTLTTSPSSKPADTETPGPTETVTLEGVAFDPKRLAVDPGSTVRWINDDSFGHDVTAAQFHDVAVEWDFAASLGGGESVSHTFESAGVYEYLCTIHGQTSMCGVVLVGDAALEESLPCSSDGESY